MDDRQHAAGAEEAKLPHGRAYDPEAVDVLRKGYISHPVVLLAGFAADAHKRIAGEHICRYGKEQTQQGEYDHAEHA